MSLHKSLNLAIAWSPHAKFMQKNIFIEETQVVNYKNIFLLRKYISIEGKILPKRLTRLNAKQQRAISKSIKTARILGFLPFVYRIFY